MWADSKFRRLTRPQPCGQSLWQYLLTCREATSLPGLIVGGERHFAEALGWSLKGFREAFQEVFREGMAKADWRAGVVWLPNARNYNRPESPNVVRSWENHWDDVPECGLKSAAFEVLKAFAEGLGKGFGEAFAKACRKPCPNQEQEQEPDPEQEQEQEGSAEGSVTADTSGDAPASPPPPDPATHKVSFGAVGPGRDKEQEPAEQPTIGPTAPRTRRRTTVKSLLPADWMPTLEHIEQAKTEGGKNQAWVRDQAARMRDWAASKGERKVDWDAAFRNWIRRAFESNGGGSRVRNTLQQPCEGVVTPKEVIVC